MAQYTEALQHLHTALAIMEEHDLIGVMSQLCGNIGAVHAMRTEYSIASIYFKRALALAERTGDVPSKVLVTGNLGDVAARIGDLQEASTWLTESLTLAEHISDREHSSWVLTALATARQDLGDLQGALGYIRRSLATGRSVKSTVRVGFALVALADWRATCALMRTPPGTTCPDQEEATSASLHLLHSARRAVERALAFEDIDVETQCTGQVVLTAIYHQLGDRARALPQAIKTLAEVRQSEMMHLVGRSHRLLGEIQAASGLVSESVASFEEALQIFKQYGLRLDYARTLQRYGSSLLARSRSGKSGRASSTRTSLYARGLSHLQEARAIFESCHASLDLQWVEHLLADLDFSAARS
jgi:tetratricopeptide (TPR) repeat protein